MLESFSFAWITQPEAWLAFSTLLLLEVVLGIDNVIFISILAGKLPAALQARARTVGLMAALVMRVLLLFSVAWIARLTEPLFTVFNHAFSGRDLILLAGGLFLLYKAVTEMHEQLEGPESHVGGPSKSLSFAAVIGQIMVLDVVFSLDSVITAIGMADDLGVMVSAVIVTVIIMLFAAGPISGFVQKHPTIKMLALAFLLLIGVNLVADGLGLHIPKGYTYFSMGFAIAVELLNLRLRAGKAVALNEKQA